VTGLLRAELLKIRSTRMWWGLLAGALVFVAVQVVALILVAGQQGAPSLDQASTVRTVWGSAGTGSTFVLVLGILGMTTEYRHMTITSTFLATPRRGRVVVAKLVAHAVFGVLFGVACVALTAALAVPLLALKGAATIPTSTILQVLAASVVGLGVYAVVGVGVGSFIRNQIAAIVGALVWVFLVESLVIALLPQVGKWLPGGAASAMLQATSTRGHLLEPWAGGLLFLGYGLAFAALAAVTTQRRDIT
jgi:ABC-2 type transport system permease protein